jgi:hypothetical protein
MNNHCNKRKFCVRVCAVVGAVNDLEYNIDMPSTVVTVIEKVSPSEYKLLKLYAPVITHDYYDDARIHFIINA